jgi:hypothetical protein
MEREDTHTEVTTINTSPLIRRGDMGECTRIVNGTLVGVRVMHIHSVGGGEVHAPATWMEL